MSTPSYRAPLTYSVPEPKTRFGLTGPGSNMPGFGLAGAIGGAVALVVLVAGLIWVATTGQAPPTRHPHVFAGSLVLEDYRPLTVVDIATGAVTVQLEGVDAEVGAPGYYDVQAVPVAGGTMLVNRETGMFNMLGNDDYVLGPTNTGISLGSLRGSHTAAGFPDGGDVYIVRYGPDTTVSLVAPSTVEAGAQAVDHKRHRAVHALGALGLQEQVVSASGAATVAGGSLWLLAKAPGSCSVVSVGPSPKAPQGLAQATATTWAATCARAAIETAGVRAALARPGGVELWSKDNRGRWAPYFVHVPGTAAATRFVPVAGPGPTAWFLFKGPSGWSLFGAEPSGALTGPLALAQLGNSARPAQPALSGRYMYTLNQAAPGQPTIWQIDTATGRMRPVPGAQQYPAKSVTEKAIFQGVQFLVDGPRVIVNNPGSLLAVVLFTDGSHKPVVIDKSTAVVVSAAGPGDVNVKPKQKQGKHPHAAHGKKPRRHPGHKGTNAQSSTTVTTRVAATTPPTTLPPQPVQQVVNPQVNCATTTERPYQPQITSVTPSDQAALVAWQYRLLSEQDCLPSTWAVQVTALDGAPQPVQPLQAENGEQQLLVTGLRPGDHYRVVVTAYINRQSTASEPFEFATTATGPGAPASVSASANGSGGWTVSWTACKGQGCQVAAEKWSVIGSACQSSVVTNPPNVTANGSQRSVTINAGSSAALLGDSLRFTVQGISSDGLRGTPSPPSACATSWQPPAAADLSLLAAAVPAGQALTAQLQVVATAGVSPLVALGSADVAYTYNLAGQIVGPTSASQVEVPGLAPAKQYQAEVTITPLGHPGAKVTLTSATFSKTLLWPMTLSMRVTGTVANDGNSGTVIASLSGLPDQSALAAGGSVQCGSESLAVSGALSAGQFQAPVDLDQLGGRCTLSLRLHSTAVPDPFGVPSPILVQTFTIGAQSPYSFSAVAVGNCARCGSASIDVSYDGSSQPPGADWTVAASAGACSTSSGPSPVANFPVVLQWPETCPVPVITVTWAYLGQVQSAQAHLPGLPQPPTSVVPTSAPVQSTSPVNSSPVNSSAPASSTPAVTVPAATTTTTTPAGCTSFHLRNCQTTTTVPTTTVPTTTVPTTTVPTTSAPAATTSMPPTTATTVPVLTTVTLAPTSSTVATTPTTTATSTSTTNTSTSGTATTASSTTSTSSSTTRPSTTTATTVVTGSSAAIGGAWPGAGPRPPSATHSADLLWLALGCVCATLLAVDLAWYGRRVAGRSPYRHMEATA